MKICFVIGTLSYSGAEKIMYNLLKELSIRNYDLSIILISCEKKYDYEDLKYVKQYPIFNKEEIDLNVFMRIKRRQKKIYNIINGNNFDLVVSFGSKFNVDVVEACKKLPVKLILCERNDPVNDPKSKLQRIRRKVSYKRAHGFVFQTKEIQSFFSYSIQNRSIVIPNFIDKEVLMDNLKVKKRNSFVTCARLDDNQKNQSGLIKAFSEFALKNNEYLLEIYGDGPDLNKYKELVRKLNIENRVIFHGYVKNPITQAKKCKIFIFTSRYEGMPNALIEAMANGMACIATNCGGGGAKYLIKNGENGILIDYGDDYQLLEAMNNLVKDDLYIKKLGYHAYKINDVLNKEKVIDMWEKYFKEIIGSN